MVNHDKQMYFIKKEQKNWERSHDFGYHLLVFNEVQSELLKCCKQTENLIGDVCSWSLWRCFLIKFTAGSDELLPRVY